MNVPKLLLTWLVFIVGTLVSYVSSGLSAEPALAVPIFAPDPDAKLTSVADPNTSTAARSGSPGITMRQFFDGRKHPDPTLPIGAAAKRLSGKVVLRVDVAESGEVGKVEVVHSSGSALLDEAARAWITDVWRYPRADKASVSQEQVESKTTDQDVENDARSAAYGRKLYQDTPRPGYPCAAVIARRQGSVRLDLTPDKQGNVREAKIIAGSGTLLLDLTAKAWIESHWKLPTKKAVECVVSFRLR